MKYELVESKLNDVFKFLIITLVGGEQHKLLVF